MDPLDMCEEGFGARRGTSADSTGTGMLPPLAFAGTWKGNSPASLLEMGEPVGAERMILGAPSEGEGLCMSCVSFLGCPRLSGDSSRPDSSVLPDTAGDRERGLRVVGEPPVLLEPTMVTARKRQKVSVGVFSRRGRVGVWLLGF